MIKERMKKNNNNKGRISRSELLFLLASHSSLAPSVIRPSQVTGIQVFVSPTLINTAPSPHQGTEEEEEEEQREEEEKRKSSEH